MADKHGGLISSRAFLQCQGNPLAKLRAGFPAWRFNVRQKIVLHFSEWSTVPGSDIPFLQFVQIQDRDPKDRVDDFRRLPGSQHRAYTKRADRRHRTQDLGRLLCLSFPCLVQPDIPLAAAHESLQIRIRLAVAEKIECIHAQLKETAQADHTAAGRLSPNPLSSKIRL